MVAARSLQIRREQPCAHTKLSEIRSREEPRVRCDVVFSEQSQGRLQPASADAREHDIVVDAGSRTPQICRSRGREHQRHPIRTVRSCYLLLRAGPIELHALRGRSYVNHNGLPSASTMATVRTG